MKLAPHKGNIMFHSTNKRRNKPKRDINSV